MQRTLVSYYSWSGNTAKLAREIADAIGADVDAIEDAVPRQGTWSYVRSSLEAVAAGLPAIRTQRDPQNYDLVVLGAPVWAGTLASPMRSFLFRNGPSLRRIACFCTMGGRGGPHALAEMMALCGQLSAPVFSCTEAEMKTGRYRTTLEDYLQELRKLTQAPLAA